MKKFYLIAACYEKDGMYYAETDGFIVAVHAREARKKFKAEREASLKMRVKVEHCEVAR
jgi:hypothetical protein